MRKAKQVVIGNSAAGLNAVKAIRRYDKSCHITVISAEDCWAYSPVLLPYYISGRIKKAGMFIADGDFYERNAIELLLGREVAGLDVDNHRVCLQDGGEVEYDNLLIASGGTPRKLDVPGGDMPKVMTLRSIDDAQRIVEASKSASEILISGAGLASLEIANALLKRHKKITVMAKSDQVLSRNADAECANIIQKAMEDAGIGFLLGRDIAEIAAHRGRLRVVTDRNDNIATDMVIVGKGVDPNVRFLKKAGLKTGRGILVDEQMRTNIAGVFAAGDVAEAKDLITGRNQVMANWASACIEGEIAGLNMVGCSASLPGEVSYNIVPIFNRTAAFMGDALASSPSIEIVAHRNERKGVYRRFVLRDNRIIGATLLEGYSDVGIVRSLIVKGIDVSHRKNELASSPYTWGKMLRDAS